jgi:uridine kinase
LCYKKLCELLTYKDIEIPVYDFTTHSRVENECLKVKAQPIIIFEGIMSMYESRFRDLMDLKIFVLTDDDVRLARRVKRDIAERGRSIE